MGKELFMSFVDTEGMSDEEKKQWASVGEAIEKTAEKIFSGSAKKDFKESLIDELKGMDEFKKQDLSEFISKKSFDDKIVEMEESILKIKALTEKSSEGVIKFKSLEDQIESQLKEFIVDEKGIKTLDLKEACQKSPGYKKNITIAIDRKAATITSGGAPRIGNELDPVLSVDPRAQTIIREVSNVTTTNNRSLTYAEFVAGEGDAEWVPEGGLKPAMDATLQEKTITAGKVALTSKLTEEAIMDLPQFVAEVKSEILNRIGLKEEEGILKGSGTGGEIKGVLSDIPAFVLTGLSIDMPNKYDAIVAAYTQVISTSNMAYRANAVLMNPVDYAGMQLEKDKNGQYLRPFKIGDELIQGLRVISSTAVELGTITLGDFTYLNIRDYMLLTLQVGWVNDDFQKNLVTLVGEKRLMAYIKSQYKTAFVHDTFDNIITAIAASA